MLSFIFLLAVQLYENNITSSFHVSSFPYVEIFLNPKGKILILNFVVCYQIDSREPIMCNGDKTMYKTYTNILKPLKFAICVQINWHLFPR